MKIKYFLMRLKIKVTWLLNMGKQYEPRHDKTNIVRLRPAWIKTSLRIRAV
jgi:hypothetical protein